MALDLAISRAITMAHVLERALHDPGFWTMELCGFHVQAGKLIEDDRVVFIAEFPKMTPGVFPLSLYCDEDLVLSRNVTLREPAEESFVAEWSIALPLGVAA
jgi:hypothetical protein